MTDSSLSKTSSSIFQTFLSKNEVSRIHQLLHPSFSLNIEDPESIKSMITDIQQSFAASSEGGASNDFAFLAFFKSMVNGDELQAMKEKMAALEAENGRLYEEVSTMRSATVAQQTNRQDCHNSNSNDQASKIDPAASYPCSSTSSSSAASSARSQQPLLVPLLATSSLELELLDEDDESDDENGDDEQSDECEEIAVSQTILHQPSPDRQTDAEQQSADSQAASTGAESRQTAIPMICERSCEEFLYLLYPTAATTLLRQEMVSFLQQQVKKACCNSSGQLGQGQQGSSSSSNSINKVLDISLSQLKCHLAVDQIRVTTVLPSMTPPPPVGSSTAGQGTGQGTGQGADNSHSNWAKVLYDRFMILVESQQAQQASSSSSSSSSAIAPRSSSSSSASPRFLLSKVQLQSDLVHQTFTVTGYLTPIQIQTMQPAMAAAAVPFEILSSAPSSSSSSSPSLGGGRLGRGHVELYLLAFYEEASLLIGQDSLLKRAVLLIKAWWVWEAAAGTTGVAGTTGAAAMAVSGSTAGGGIAALGSVGQAASSSAISAATNRSSSSSSSSSIASYLLPDHALWMMILIIFHRYGEVIHTPLQALRHFLRHYHRLLAEAEAGVVEGSAAEGSRQQQQEQRKRVVISLHGAAEQGLDGSYGCSKGKKGMIPSRLIAKYREMVYPPPPHGMMPGGQQLAAGEGDDDGYLLVVCNPFTGENLITGEKLSQRKIQRLAMVLAQGHALLEASFTIPSPAGWLQSVFGHAVSALTQQAKQQQQRQAASASFSPMTSPRLPLTSPRLPLSSPRLPMMVASPRTALACMSPRDLFYVDLAAILWQYLYYLSLLYQGIVCETALLMLCREVLQEKRCLPVGEVGKVINDLVTANSCLAYSSQSGQGGQASLSNQLKEKFGGLKKFLENYPEIFYMPCSSASSTVQQRQLVDHHPYNPMVTLQKLLRDEDKERVERGEVSLAAVFKAQLSAATAGGGGGSLGGSQQGQGQGGGAGQGSSSSKSKKKANKKAAAALAAAAANANATVTAPQPSSDAHSVVSSSGEDDQNSSLVSHDGSGGSCYGRGRGPNGGSVPAVVMPLQLPATTTATSSNNLMATTSIRQSRQLKQQQQQSQPLKKSQPSKALDTLRNNALFLDLDRAAMMQLQQQRSPPPSVPPPLNSHGSSRLASYRSQQQQPAVFDDPLDALIYEHQEDYSDDDDDQGGEIAIDDDDQDEEDDYIIADYSIGYMKPPALDRQHFFQLQLPIQTLTNQTQVQQPANNRAYHHDRSAAASYSSHPHHPDLGLAGPAGAGYSYTTTNTTLPQQTPSASYYAASQQQQQQQQQQQPPPPGHHHQYQGPVTAAAAAASPLLWWRQQQQQLQQSQHQGQQRLQQVQVQGHHQQGVTSGSYHRSLQQQQQQQQQSMQQQPAPFYQRPPHHPF